jgi:nitrogen fixation protein FixH
MRHARAGDIPGLSGRHVLRLIVGFFATVFAVNGWFLYAALSTHTGLVAQEPYRKGLAYNERIAASERQEQLGWKADVAIAEARLEVRLSDTAEAPVTGRFVAAVFGRPSTERFDRAITLTEAAPGVYVSAPLQIDGGTWVASVDVRALPGAEPTFRMRRRLWVR